MMKELITGTLLIAGTALADGDGTFTGYYPCWPDNEQTVYMARTVMDYLRDPRAKPLTLEWPEGQKVTFKNIPSAQIPKSGIALLAEEPLQEYKTLQSNPLGPNKPGMPSFRGDALKVTISGEEREEYYDLGFPQGEGWGIWYDQDIPDTVLDKVQAVDFSYGSIDAYLEAGQPQDPCQNRMRFEIAVKEACQQIIDTLRNWQNQDYQKLLEQERQKYEHGG
ncbi:MAG: hypothetical protein V1725_00875 [archaeon]